MFAMPPSYLTNRPCIIISAKVYTYVTVKYGSTAIFWVGDNSSVKFNVHNDQRVTEGVEFKGYVLTSDDPVSVHIETEYQADYLVPDTIMVRPVADDDKEYIISSYLGTSTSTDTWPGSYFIPKYDDTLVQIFKYENDMWVEQHSLVIDSFRVFTQDSYYANDDADYTGWRVIASRAVGVISGHGHTHMGRYYQHVADSMPPITATGDHYITFPVLFGLGTEGYTVRIMGSATEEINVVIPELGLDDFIPKGSFLEVQSMASSSMMRVIIYYSVCL